MVNFGDFPKIHLRPGSHTRDTRARTTRCTCVQACMCKHAHRHATCACVDKAKGFNLKLLLSKGLPCFFSRFYEKQPKIVRKVSKFQAFDKWQDFVKLSKNLLPILKIQGFLWKNMKMSSKFTQIDDF